MTPGASMTLCRHCDASVDDDARFCQSCGHPLPARRISHMEAVVAGDVDATLVAELRQEKDRLALRLRELIGAAEQRALTADEQAEWTRTHKLWERVRGALTRQMQHLAARGTTERRAGDRRQDRPSGPERRSEADRRSGERRSGADRRDPFPPDTPAAD